MKYTCQEDTSSLNIALELGLNACDVIDLERSDGSVTCSAAVERLNIANPYKYGNFDAGDVVEIPDDLLPMYGPEEAPKVASSKWYWVLGLGALGALVWFSRSSSKE
jgi:hypothetical protein